MFFFEKKNQQTFAPGFGRARRALRLCACFALVFASLSAFAQTVGPPLPHHAKLGTGPMHVDNWASLGTYADLPSNQGLNVKVPSSGSEETIVVYGHSNKLDRAWRNDLRGDDAGYEPSSSVAGQRLYSPDPVWASPEQQHAASELKDAVGACGGLFGLITCPNK